MKFQKLGMIEPMPLPISQIQEIHPISILKK